MVEAEWPLFDAGIVMRISIKKLFFYFIAVLVIFGGQFLLNNGRLTGPLPQIRQQTIDGSSAMEAVSKGPAMVYFWAEWCGLCKMMQNPVSAVLKDFPGITVAVKSGDSERVDNYMQERALNWKVVNDPLGKIGRQFKVKGVPAVFFLNKKGDILLTTVGYTSEIGLRFRLWLVGLN